MISGARPLARRRPGDDRVLIAGLTVLAAAAGLLAGSRIAARDEPAPASPDVLRSGTVRLVLPAGWTAAPPPFAVAELDDPAGAHGLFADAVVGVARPEHASLLPGSLRRLAGTSRPRPLRGAGPPLRRLEFVADSEGTRLAVAVGAATAGVVTLVCRLSPAAARLGSEDCDELARGLRLGEGSWLVAGPETAARMVLPGIVARLAEQRRAGRAALAGAQTPGARVRAARAIAAAYATAAVQLRPLAAGRARALPGRLAALAAHHRALARAHAGRRRRIAVRSGAAIERDEARLARGLRWLARPAAG